MFQHDKLWLFEDKLIKHSLVKIYQLNIETIPLQDCDIDQQTHDKSRYNTLMIEIVDIVILMKC